MNKSFIKIGVGFLIGLGLAYVIYGLPEKKAAEEEALPKSGEPKKRKIIPFPLWRSARRRLP